MSNNYNFFLSSHPHYKRTPKSKFQIENDKANILLHRPSQFAGHTVRLFRKRTRHGNGTILLWRTVLFFGVKHLAERGPHEWEIPSSIKLCLL